MQEKKKLPDEVLDQLAGGVGFGVNVTPADHSGAAPASPSADSGLAEDMDRVKRSIEGLVEGWRR